MYLDVDLDLGNLLVSTPGLRTALSSVSFKFDTDGEIRVRFWSGGVQTELTGTTITGSFALKEKGKYDGDPLVSADSWTKVGTGADTYYTFVPDFFTEALETALASGDGNEDNDEDFVVAMLEIEWVIDDAKYRTTNTPQALVYNSVIKDDDAIPSGAAGLAAKAPLYSEVNPEFKFTFNVGNLTADREPWMPDYAGQFVLAELSGGFAPGGAPASAGLVWIKTDGRHWFSTGTASSANWVETVTAAGLVANSTLRSAVRAALIDSYVDRPTAEAALVDPGAVFFNNTLGILEGTRKADVVFESGTTRTLTVADNGRVIICTNAAGCTITMPIAGLGDGFNCGIISPVHDSTLSIGTGGVANGESGTKTATIAQGYQACSLLYHGSIDWIVTGNVGTFA